MDLLNFDIALTRAINGFAHVNWQFDYLAVAISLIGIQLMVLSVVAQWWCREDRPAIRHIVFSSGLSFLVALGINQFILLFFHRVRPYDNGITNLLIDKSTDSSFPSDHATASFAVAAAFVVGGDRSMGSIYVLCATAIALSRVYVGTHYVSDILGGASIGVAAAFIVRALYRRETAFDNWIKGIL